MLARPPTRHAPALQARPRREALSRRGRVSAAARRVFPARSPVAPSLLARPRRGALSRHGRLSATRCLLLGPKPPNGAEVRPQRSAERHVGRLQVLGCARAGVWAAAGRGSRAEARPPLRGHACPPTHPSRPGLAGPAPTQSALPPSSGARRCAAGVSRPPTRGTQPAGAAPTRSAVPSWSAVRHSLPVARPQAPPTTQRYRPWPRCDRSVLLIGTWGGPKFSAAPEQGPAAGAEQRYASGPGLQSRAGTGGWVGENPRRRESAVRRGRAGAAGAARVGGREETRDGGRALRVGVGPARPGWHGWAGGKDPRQQGCAPRPEPHAAGPRCPGRAGAQGRVRRKPGAGSGGSPRQGQAGAQCPGLRAPGSTSVGAVGRSGGPPGGRGGRAGGGGGGPRAARSPRPPHSPGAGRCPDRAHRPAAR